MTGPGTCTITASQAGDADYAAAQATQSFQVSLASSPPPRHNSQTVEFGPLAARNVGAMFTLSATATSGLTVAFSSDTTAVCTVSGSIATMTGPGTCTITASQAGDADYAAAQATQSFQVKSLTHTISTVSPLLIAASAAAILIVVAAAAAALVSRRRRPHSHPRGGPEPSVHAVPDSGAPEMVAVRVTGTEPTHTVRIEAHDGASTTTIGRTRP